MSPPEKTILLEDAMHSTSQPVFLDHFRALPDPRIDRTKLHPLFDILVITICAVICGADGWEAIEEFGQAKYPWLRRFLALPNGIPSHDTFARVFARIDPEQFQSCFLRWVWAVARVTNGQVLPIDGKTLRGSYDPRDAKAAVHMVSAWASANRMILAQVKTDDKSNEITAIPELLRLLDITGCIVTIDAMGCQKAIAEQIIEQEADYVLGLKGNQPHLFEDVQAVFQTILAADQLPSDVTFYQTEEDGHGRSEIRSYWMTSRIETLRDTDAWKGLQTIGMVLADREVNGQVRMEARYSISSLPNDVQQFAHAVRTHWEIENCVHWVLDVTFREDDSRIRKDHAPHNLAMLRHLVLNLLRQEKTHKGSLRMKRFRAGLDDDYLAKVLGVSKGALNADK
jgi:predicted transposase YbfD/YdcC